MENTITEQRSGKLCEFIFRHYWDSRQEAVYITHPVLKNVLPGGGGGVRPPHPPGPITKAQIYNSSSWPGEASLPTASFVTRGQWYYCQNDVIA